MNEVRFPGLDIAARRLRMSTVDRLAWVEAAIYAVGCGWSEREALTMTLREALQRKGKYHGILKTLVDSGAVFQVREDGDDGRGARCMGSKCVGTNPPSPSARCVGVVVDAG